MNIMCMVLPYLWKGLQLKLVSMDNVDLSMCHGFVSAGDALGWERPATRCRPTTLGVLSAW